MTVEVFAALACLSKWRCAYDTSAPRNSRPSTASFMHPFPLRRESQPNGHAMAGRPTTYDGGDDSDRRHRRRYRRKPPQSPKAVTTLPLDTKKGMLRLVARAVGLRLPQALGPCSPGEKERTGIWLRWQDYSALRASLLRVRPRRVNTGNGANQTTTTA